MAQCNIHIEHRKYSETMWYNAIYIPNIENIARVCGGSGSVVG